MITTYLVLTHLTREGASLTSREKDLTKIPVLLDAVITAANPTIQTSAPAKWRVIYSRVIWDTVSASCGTLDSGDPDNYRIDRDDANWVKGSLSESSKIGNDGDCARDGIPQISKLGPGQTFHSVEIYYQYSPITPAANFGVDIAGTSFYDRAIF
jgi:hypothetical protein